MGVRLDNRLERLHFKCDFCGYEDNVNSD